MNNNYLKPGSHHGAPELPPALGAAGSPGSHPGSGLTEPCGAEADGSSEITHRVSDTAPGLNDRTHQQEGGGVVNSY